MTRGAERLRVWSFWLRRAIGAYEYGGATEKFCEKHFLNAKVRTRPPLTRLISFFNLFI